MKKLLFTLLFAAAGLQGWALDQVDGVYQIGTAQDLIDFATLVNGGTKTASAVLTADIDMSGKTYTPIGNDTYRYGGTFDGQGHVINNLVLNNGGYNNQGIFGVVQGATIKNLIAGPNNSITGKDHVGGLIGITNGDELVTIENCGNEGYVEAKGTGGAAMIGICYNGGRKTKILNCYNTGNIKANAEGAVLTGWFGGSSATAEVSNFYNIGTVTGQESGKDFYRNGNDNTNITFNNVYDNHSTRYVQASKTVNACNSEWYRWPYDLNFVGSTKTTVWKFVGSVNHPRPLAEAPVSKDGDYYLINDRHDLYWFATAVNKGHSSYKAKQTADIDFTAYTNKPETGTDEIVHSVMIGWDADHPFSGEYDGQMHNVEVLYDRAEKNAGLFRYLYKATIRNLCTTGTIKNTQSCSGGIFAGTVSTDNHSDESSLVENCISSVTFDRGTTDDDATFGGIGAYMHGSGKIKNCAFIGTISAKNADGNGGILGYANGGSSVKVQNCYVNATIDVANDDDNKIIVRNTTPENCYYVEREDLRIQDGATQVTSGEVTSGKLCYRLNGTEPQNTINWYQTLAGADGYPYPFNTHKQVYKYSDDIYTNLPVASGAVQIGDADDLNTFAAEVNNGNRSMNAKLTDDIDMSGVNDYTPIGNSTDNKYAGTFDGGGKCIRNLVISTNKKYIGLFGYLTSGADIKNLIIDSTCSFTGDAKVGGVSGMADGGGQVKLSNIINAATIDATGSTDANAAGLIGCAINNTSIIATNCANMGNVSNSGYTVGTQQCAAFAGWTQPNTFFTNCWNSGIISNYEGTSILYRNSGNVTQTNCYHVTNDDFTPQYGTKVGTSTLTSGELCYRLGADFTQDLSQEGHPTFGSKTVSAGQWFNSSENDVYYNEDASNNITVYQLNLNDTNEEYKVPAKVTAKNVSVTRNMTAGQWIGLCLPFSYDIPSGWEVRELNRVNGSGESASMVFTQVATTIEAGKPYIVKPSSAVSDPITATDKTISTAASTVERGDVNMIGNFAQTSITTGSYYINTSSQLKKLNAASATLKGFRAYFTVDDISSVKALSFDFEDDDPTGISLTTALSEVDGAIYNVAGQRMNKMQKGINIINGKKILK